MDHTIGLFGLGLLGSAVAERLLASGRAVTGHDPVPETAARLAELGGSPAAADGVAGCDVLVTCLPHSGVTRAVFEQVAGQLRPGQLVLDHTTGDPADAQALGELLAARGVTYCDATVVGSSAEVRAANAVILVGAAADGLARASSILAVYARRIHHAGPVGAGATLKLVVNLVLGLNRAVLAEGLALAASCGFAPADVLDLLADSVAYSRVMDTKGPKMVRGEFEPVARLAQHRKDVALIGELAIRMGAEVPLSDLHAALLDRAIELGCGELDNSAVCQAYAALRRT